MQDVRCLFDCPYVDNTNPITRCPSAPVLLAIARAHNAASPPQTSKSPFFVFETPSLSEHFPGAHVGASHLADGDNTAGSGVVGAAARKKQAGRAASLLYSSLRFASVVKSETLPPGELVSCKCGRETSGTCTGVFVFAVVCHSY